MIRSFDFLHGIRVRAQGRRLFAGLVLCGSFAMVHPDAAGADVYVLLRGGGPAKSGNERAQDFEHDCRESGLEARPILAPGAGRLLDQRMRKAPGRRSLSDRQRSALARMGRWWRVSGTGVGGIDWGRSADVELVEAAEMSWTTVVPNDSLFVNQALFLAQLDILDAWDTVRGELGSVVVAIVDGGTEWRHPDLIENIYRNPGEIEGNGVDDDGNGFVDDVRGWNFANDSNDPTGLPSLNFNATHGTHVAGLAGARADNGAGVVGTSWNARILPINASDPEIDRGISFGYEGILYAALLGADIINTSWARPGGGTVTPQRASIFEEDVVDVARALGSLVVSAAGNNGLSDFPAYPAAYRSTLAVGATEFSGPQIWFNSNRDYWVDVMAPGVRLMSTVAGGGYAIQTGTSMAAPVVSGIAALVKTAHPEWSAEQIRQQIRWTGRDLDAVNPQAVDRMGGGLVQAEPATGPAVPGVHVEDLEFLDQDEDGLAEGGEVLRIGFDVINEGATTQNVFLRLKTDDPMLQVLDGRDTVRLPVLERGTRLEVRDGFLTWLSLRVPPGYRPTLRVEVEVDGRRLVDVFYPQLAPVDVAIGNAGIRYSLTSNGKVGFSTLTSPYSLGGEGLHRPQQRSVLLGGGLLIGDGPERVSDAVQPARPLDIFEDFRPLQGQGLSRSAGVGRVETRASFSDRVSAQSLGVGVVQRAMAGLDSDRADFVILSSEVEAQVDSLFGVRFGVLVDWEMTFVGSDRDRIVVDPEERLLMATTTTPVAELSAWAAVAVVEGPGGFSTSWLHDVRPASAPRDSALYDASDLESKPSDAALWQWMSAGPRDGDSPVGAVASVLAVGPFDLPRSEKRPLVLAWLLGESESEIRRALAEARLAWDEWRLGAEQIRSSPVAFLPTVPNPAIDEAEIRFRVPVGGPVRLTVFDLRGRKVRELVNASLSSGVHRVRWAGEDGSGRAVARGVYPVLLQTSQGSRSTSLLWWGH